MWRAFFVRGLRLDYGVVRCKPHLINGEVNTGTKMSGYPTNQALGRTAANRVIYLASVSGVLVISSILRTDGTAERGDHSSARQ
jgi:hypothetical protein